MNSIFGRRSIRKYEDRPVEQEKVELLLKAAMAAPTAGNQREWEFMVVNDRTLLEKLSKASPYAGCTAKAGVAIVPLAARNRMSIPDKWEQDLGACCENILLEAVELGLGGVWLGAAADETCMGNIRAIFDIPDDVLPFAILSIGYPAEEKPATDRYESDRVHFNRY